ERYSKESHRIGKILDASEVAINVTMELLAKEFGLRTTQYIPSQNVLLPLFDFAFHRAYKSVKDISEGDQKKMLFWFLVASFNGTYSASPNRKIEEDLQLIREGYKKFPLDKLLSSMKDRPPHQTTINKADIIENAYYNVLRGRTGKEY